MVEIILPIILCLTLGKVLSKISMFKALDWSSLEKIMFWVFLPLLIFRSIVQGEFNIADSSKLALIFFLAQVIAVIFSLLHAYFGKLSKESMTSLFQSSVRWNNVIPISIVSTYYGVDGMSVVAVALAVMVPIANISCIFTLEYALSSKTSSFFKKIQSVLKNPLIIACLLGLLIKILGVSIPSVFWDFSNILASSTLGVGLLAVGAGTSFISLKRDKVHIVLAAFTKLVFMPSVLILLCLFFNIKGVVLIVAALCAAAPTAMQGYIVAKNMGGDSDLMGSAISSQHIISLVSIPIVLYVATYLST